MTLLTRIYVNTSGNILKQLKLTETTSLIWKRQNHVIFSAEYMPKGKLMQKSLDEVIKGKTNAINAILSTIPMLENSLSNSSNCADIDWQEIKNAIDDLGKGKYNNILVIDLCYRYKNYDAAIAYVKYLRNQGYEINLALAGRYLRCYFDRNKPLTAAEEQDVLTVINDIRRTHEMLDQITTKHIVYALSMTSKWEDGIAITKAMNSKMSNNKYLLQAIIIAAFNNSKLQTAFELLATLIDIPFVPSHPEVYKSHLLHCDHHRQEDLIPAIEEVFNIWNTDGYVASPDELEVYTDRLQQLGWTVKNTEVDKSQCENCSQKLDRVIISHEACEELRDAVLDRLVIGSDIYESSSPQELKHFRAFLQRNQFYDVVIDGLNVLYLGLKHSTQISGVIEYILSKHSRILLILRRHAVRYFSRYLNHPQIIHYVVGDLSKDDVYLLYATLIHGCDVRFLSADLMRQHKFKMEKHYLHRIFRDWQLSHQYRILTSPSSKKLRHRIKDPIPHRVAPTKSNGIWHIPVIDNDQRGDPFYARWVCLVPPSKQYLTTGHKVYSKRDNCDFKIEKRW